MAVLGVNSRAACFSHFHSRHCEINFFKRRRRVRIDAKNGHRRVTRPNLRIIKAETQGFPTSYLRAPSGSIQYNREQHELKKRMREGWNGFGIRRPRVQHYESPPSFARRASSRRGRAQGVRQATQDVARWQGGRGARCGKQALRRDRRRQRQGRPRRARAPRRARGRGGAAARAVRCVFRARRPGFASPGPV